MRVTRAILMGLTTGLAMATALPALADDICRRPCTFYLPQQGEADPAAYGCHDLIDNLSGTCALSVWDEEKPGDVDIRIEATTGHFVAVRHTDRQQVLVHLD